MSAEINIVQRVTEITINERTIELTKGWSGELTSVLLPTYTSGSLPSASPDGQVIFISDEGVLAYSSGGEWIS